ncbi:SMI1/KNR4 family protein [Nostoc sp. LEGE 06077]|uniref:SMI1/KNR4 family protein n=1 Tax=Nostoc sp. LEGE 06077 TaxID=915325 RepID=UPI00187EEDD8|nr:SMI1/KNR4 family protein [Nostoc sp. LEGE 06077]MBE9208123.1 SMI1/KNR4 family protein [Nostoc sp. LEGE 06077]
MSLLTQTLERILVWLQANCPSVASFPYPGLTNEQIQELTKDLPFKLPREVKELYQWRNGTLHGQGFFPFSVFYSLEESLDFYYKTVKYQPDDTLLMASRNSLILFSTDKSFFFVVADEENNNTSQVWVVYTGDHPVICYTSLTNLILMMADCYESGAYYVGSSGFLEEGRTKSDSFFCKYHPGIENRPDLGLY